MPPITRRSWLAGGAAHAALGDRDRAETDLRTALDLDDSVLTIKLTPNRADCLSVVGVAREVAALRRHAQPTFTSLPISALL